MDQITNIIGFSIPISNESYIAIITKLNNRLYFEIYVSNNENSFRKELEEENRHGDFKTKSIFSYLNILNNNNPPLIKAFYSINGIVSVIKETENGTEVLGSMFPNLFKGDCERTMILQWVWQYGLRNFKRSKTK